MYLSSYLRMCDWYRTNPSIDSSPGACSKHTGKQGVQISSSQSTTVTLHLGHVTFNQSLPQPTIVQPEIRMQDLGGKGRRGKFG